MLKALDPLSFQNFAKILMQFLWVWIFLIQRLNLDVLFFSKSHLGPMLVVEDMIF